MNDLKIYKYAQPNSYDIGDRLFYKADSFDGNYVEVEIIDIYIEKCYGLTYETIIKVKQINSDIEYKVILSDDGYRLVVKI